MQAVLTMRRGRLDLVHAARVYAITPDRDPQSVYELAAAVLRGGAHIVQLRHKSLARGELLQLAERLRQLTRAAGAGFIVNDHVDIALLAEADGVHLGADDMQVASTRRIAGPELIIGASASTPGAAREAVACGADYIGAGPAFATPLKPAKAVIGPAGVDAVSRAVNVPVFAIGGIDENNVQELWRIGVKRVCVIRALGDSPDPEGATRRLRAMLEG